MDTDQISYQVGIPEQHRSVAVALFDEAFGKKLSVAVKNGEVRKRLFHEGFTLNYAVSAVSKNELQGIAGFHSTEGSLTGDIGYRDLLSQLGFIKGNWAAFIFSPYERKPEPGELVMDGIAVRASARGKGIGSALLNQIREYAKQHGYNRVRLDVIDTNPKSKRLYERMGFKAMKTEKFPYLQDFLGFGGVTTMQLKIRKDI